MKLASLQLDQNSTAVLIAVSQGIVLHRPCSPLAPHAREVLCLWALLSFYDRCRKGAPS